MEVLNPFKYEVIKVFYLCFLQTLNTNNTYFVDAMRNTLTPKAEEIIGRRAEKSARWRVRGIGYERYEVRDGRLDAIVDMNNRTCSCLQWQVSGLPCGHAIATARHKGRTDCSDLAIGYYTSDTYRRTYREVINPAGPPDSWVTPPGGLPPCYPPLITKRGAGRPRKNDRRPSRGEDPIQRNCDRCGATGHTRGECSTPPDSTVRRSTQRFRSQGPAELEPHGTLEYESVDLNVDFD